MRPMQTSTGRPSRSSAFTLLEIVIAVAVLAILAGAAVPVASKAFLSKARRGTRVELEELAESAAEFFRDTRTLPDDALDLMADPGVTGWTGPYVATQADASFHGMTDYDLDAWGRPYAFTRLDASRLELASAGQDGQLGTSSDLTVVLDVTPIRRELTLEQLATINQAITQYNRERLPDRPLSTSYASIVSSLVQAGLLPSAVPYRTDAWGDTFVPSPPGRSPVVRVDSIHLDPSLVNGAGAGGGGASVGGGRGNRGARESWRARKPGRAREPGKP